MVQDASHDPRISVLGLNLKDVEPGTPLLWFVVKDSTKCSTLFFHTLHPSHIATLNVSIVAKTRCKIGFWETASTKAQGLISTYTFSQKGFLTEDTINAL